MNQYPLPATAIIAMVVAMAVSTEAQPMNESEVSIPAVGARGTVGPDVPLNNVEKNLFAKRIVVEGRTAEAVQAV